MKKRELFHMIFAFTLTICISSCRGKQDEPEKEPPRKDIVAAEIKFPEIEEWKPGEVKTYKGEELYREMEFEGERDLFVLCERYMVELKDFVAIGISKGFIS